VRYGTRYNQVRVTMSKRGPVAHELNTAEEEDLDALLDLILAIKARRAETPAPMLAESSLASLRRSAVQRPF
jgi:hypothetical protein